MLAIQRGVRLGCALSGMLYCLAVKLFVHKLRKAISGFSMLYFESRLLLSAYTDGVGIVKTQALKISAVSNFGGTVV